MKDDRLNYILAGGFVLLMLVGFIVTLAVLGGRTGATERYLVVYDNVLGLNLGTQVLYEGFSVGQIEEIRPEIENNQQRFAVEISVSSDFAIPVDSVATVTASGLLSAVVIDIQAGQKAATIPPGGQIESREAQNVLEAVTAVAGDVSEITERTIKPLIDDLAQRVPEIARNIEEFSAELNAAGQRLGDIVSERNSESVSTTLRNVEDMSNSFASLAADLQSTRGELDAMLKTLRKVVDENEGSVDSAVADLQYTLESVARHIDAVNHNLEGTSRNMNEFSRQIRQNPALLLGGSPPSDDGAATPARQ